MDKFTTLLEERSAARIVPAPTAVLPGCYGPLPSVVNCWSYRRVSHLGLELRATAVHS